MVFSCENIARWGHPHVLVTEHNLGDSCRGTLAYSDDLLSVLVSTADPSERWDGLDDPESGPPRPDLSNFARVGDTPVCSSRGRQDPGPSGPILAHCLRLKRTGMVAVVVDCGTEAEAIRLRGGGLWAALAAMGEGKVRLVLHRARWEVVETAGYRELVRALPGARHVSMRSRGGAEFGFTGSLGTLLRLGEVDGTAFGPPAASAVKEGSAPEGAVEALGGRFSAFALHDDGTCELEPGGEGCTKAEEVPGPSTAGGRDGRAERAERAERPTVAEVGGNRGAAAMLRDSILGRGPAPKRPRVAGPIEGLPSVTFLGTGCAEPSKYRGSTGILVEWAHGSVLLDCGEGAWGQMVRLFGEEGARKRASRLACVWVSHKHADHLLGLASLLRNRPVEAPRVLLVGPHVANRYLRSLGAALGTRGGGYLFKHHTHLARDARTFSHFFRGTGLESLTSVPVVHCKDAWACVLRHRDGWKVSFSGDTRPCDEFVVASRGSDLLIHEATFESKYSAHAHKKRHCTISEALRVSDEVGAGLTVLTHFSQRYPRVPDELHEAVTGSPGGLEARRVCVAFDGMKVEGNRLGEYTEMARRVSEALREAEAEGNKE